MDSSIKTRENYWRRYSKRLGLFLRKSRARLWSIDDHCGYQIADPHMNVVLYGGKV
ncbi:MAG: hypothetical protein A4E53_00805 [Pelotomaculum sp. PtaB.Bin104]|nr:MAG: hypothetical protein A4E53_00805 [Pelotomaculum sp. PtaB.Bin104]